MIDITIKTLDSRNHVFSVEDELTVKQLKERIAEPVNVPVESQRLIYCGRVLVDEKKLSEYDVNGKVIHLVQRAPPSTSQDNSSGVSEPRATSTPRRGPFRTIITPGRIEGAGGNAMYLGAMAFPADLMDAQGISMPQPRHRLSQSRLTVARGMLRRARYTLLGLENPTHSETPPNENTNQEELQPDLVEEIVVDLTAGTSNVGVQHPPHVNVEGSSASVGDGEMQSDEAEPTPERNSPEDTPSGEESTSQNTNGETSDATRNGNQRYRYPGPVHMAEIISYVRDVERRLSPFLERFYDLVRTDPILENPAEAQRLFDQVSKMMHYLAHAYHAISDIMCDFSQPPPRRLRCRPVLIQHSAVLQTGIPIQAQVNVGGGGNVSFSSSSSTPLNNNNQTSANASSSEAGASDSRTTESSSTPESSRSQAQPQPPPPPPQQGSTSEPGGNISGRAGNLSGGNFEVYMDVGQGSITIDSVEATLVTNSGQGGSGGTSISTGSLPWGTPPPEFLQNLMQALAGHMALAGAVSTNSASGGSGGSSSASAGTSSTAAGSGSSNSEANVTNSQARGNTSTQPTTSTQTRSTTRPHVHISPGFQGREHRGIGPGFFDPFLPCNSHHIHGTRRRIDVQETAANNNNGGASSQSTSQSTGTSTENTTTRTTAASDVPSFINLFSHIFSGIRASTVPSQGQPSLIRILPRDVTVFLQGSPSAQGRENTTVAELLQSLPDHSYTEGSSIFTDFVMTLARNMRVADVLNMGTPNSNILRNLRPVLRDFVRNQLLGGNEGNQAVSDAVNRINAELRPLIDNILSQEDIPFREDVDIVATINQLNHATIPVFIRDILEEEERTYLRNIPNHCNDYIRHLATILFYCCRNGQQGLEAIYTILARRVIVGVPSALQNWSVVNIVSQLRAMSSVLDTSREAIQPYLVYRMADAPVTDSADAVQAMETESVQAEADPSPAPAETAPDYSPSRVINEEYPIWRYSPSGAMPTPEIMQGFPADYSPPDLHPGSSVPQDFSPPEYSSPGIIINQRDSGITIPPAEIERDLSWHSAVPPDWVPIISRDRERQRRQAVQGALSDAYLAGMPSKRRKMVTSAKPHTNLTRVITESMNSALGAAGVDSAEPGLAETAGGDSSLRAAYKEQVRNTLTPTLRQHPDFTPEKYPAAAKLFTSK